MDLQCQCQQSTGVEATTGPEFDRDPCRGYLMENHLRQRLLQAGAPCSDRAALEALEPLRVVTYDRPARLPLTAAA